MRDLGVEAGFLASNYVTLDDLAFLSAARTDPTGFLAGLALGGEPVIIDEVQHAPELFPAIKAAVDRERRPGRFLLTGSANVLMLPNVSESLAGRIEILTLWPLAQAEIAGTTSSFVDLLFSEISPMVAFGTRSAPTREDIINRILAGGYPEPLTRTVPRRQDWFAAYLTTILQRDVRDIANIEGITQMPRLLALLATRVASLLNVSDLSRTADIPYSTLQRYLTLLEATYLIRLLPAWSNNLGTRLLKTPKVLLSDTGLTGHLMGASTERIAQTPDLLGGLLENFVAMEIIKDIGWSTLKPTPYHWHTAKRQKVDLLLEARDGRLIGIEVKAASSISADAFKGLRALKESMEDRFVRGIVLYSGSNIVPFGENLFAVPMRTLWDR